MEELLKQTGETGVDMYTQRNAANQLLFGFQEYPHFVGNYGSSWWRQTRDFENFNGVILFTTNCIIPPKRASTYIDRVYTTDAAGFDGFKHIPDEKDGKPKDFFSIDRIGKEMCSTY